MTAVADREYGELLRKGRPRAIRTRADHAKLTKEIENLAILGRTRTQAQTEYYRVVQALVENYERSIQVDTWPKLEPIAALHELMALKNVTQSDVASALGNRSAASLILNGHRAISKAQAKKLAVLFGVDASMFI